MENIHILSTNEQSRLYTTSITPQLIIGKVSNWLRAIQIYITNNEDIKDNDYIITKDGRLVRVSYLLSKDVEGAFKVVLTTDQELIKNGIQPIPDEFLEWFIKNQSCESVEVIIVNRQCDEKSCGNCQCTDEYKIIFTKEEPKQERVCNCELKESEHNVRQETLSLKQLLSYYIDINVGKDFPTSLHSIVTNAYNNGVAKQKSISFNKKEIMNALHKIEIKENRNYSNLFESLMKNLVNEK